MASTRALQSLLMELDPVYYTRARVETLSDNDMVYAIRQSGAEDSLALIGPTEGSPVLLTRVQGETTNRKIVTPASSFGEPGPAGPPGPAGGAQTTQADLQAALDTGHGVGHRGDITLTSTLFVREESCILDCRNTRFIWNGPVGGIPIQVERAKCYLAGFTVIPGTSDIGPCIDMANENAPRHSASSIIDRVNLGLYNQRRIDAGIRISGQVNGDSFDCRNIWVSGAKVAAVDVLNPQAINGGFDGLWMGFNERGIWLHGSDAGGSYGPARFLVRRTNSHFATTADFVLGPFSSMDVQGFNGEHSKRLAALAGGSFMRLEHGYWQRGVEAVPEAEGVILGPGGGADSWLALEDFDFSTVVAGSGKERALNIWRHRWDMSPANTNNVDNLDPGPRPHPLLIANRHPWWDTTLNRWIYNDQVNQVWRDAVGTVVA